MLRLLGFFEEDDQTPQSKSEVEKVPRRDSDVLSLDGSGRRGMSTTSVADVMKEAGLDESNRNDLQKLGIACAAPPARDIKPPPAVSDTGNVVLITRPLRQKPHPVPLPPQDLGRLMSIRLWLTFIEAVKAKDDRLKPSAEIVNECVVGSAKAFSSGVSSITNDTCEALSALYAECDSEEEKAKVRGLNYFYRILYLSRSFLNPLILHLSPCTYFHRLKNLGAS